MYEIYNILNNDTIDSIAKDYDTTIDKLSEINGFLPNFKLIPGNNIIVPSNKYNPYKYYTVKKGDTISKIANDNNTNSNLILKINGLDKDDYIYPNQTLLIPKKNYKFYLTNKEDTVREISKKLNIEPSSLVKENPNLLLSTNQIIIFREK